MSALEFPALFVRSRSSGPLGARVRYRSLIARRAIRLRRPRRLRLNLSVLTTSGALTATLAGLTLYGATLDVRSPPRQRAVVALRLPSGWRVKARVRWRLGRRCGVTFLTPVADFARLLRESRTAGQGPRGPRRRPKMAAPRFERIDWRRRSQRTIARIQRMSRQLLRWCRTL